MVRLARNAGCIVGRFRRVLWWSVHATTVLLVLLTVFSYIPNSWAGKYKHNTGKPMNGVYAQYIVWSGRAECTLLFDDYDPEKVRAVHTLFAEGGQVSINHRWDPAVSLALSAALQLERPKSMFALPKLRYSTRTWDSKNGKLYISIPIIYPLLLCAACSAWLIWLRSRKIPMGCCQSCGYALDGLTIHICPECGVERA